MSTSTGKFVLTSLVTFLTQCQPRSRGATEIPSRSVQSRPYYRSPLFTDRSPVNQIRGIETDIRRAIDASEGDVGGTEGRRGLVDRSS